MQRPTEHRTTAEPGLAADDTGRPRRRIGSRRGLPSRRAALGALLITGSALVAFVAARHGEAAPLHRYVVATRDLVPGEVLTADDLTLVAADLPASVASGAFEDPSPLTGAVTRGPIAAGSLLTTAAVATGPETLTGSTGESSGHYRELSFAVPRARALLGDLAPGDRIDVLAAVDDRTQVLVQQALVLTTSSAADRALAVSDDVVVTVALTDPTEALAVAHGAAVGELTILRSTRADDRLAPTYPFPTTTPPPNTVPTGTVPTGTVPAGTSRTTR